MAETRTLYDWCYMQSAPGCARTITEINEARVGKSKLLMRFRMFSIMDSGLRSLVELLRCTPSSPFSFGVCG